MGLFPPTKCYCNCGGRYLERNRKRHWKTKRHTAYMALYMQYLEKVYN